MKNILLSFVLLLSFVGCSPKEDIKADIVVSSYALQFLVEEIVPDTITVSVADGEDLNDATSARLVMYIDKSYDSKLSDVANAVEIYPLLNAKYDSPMFWMSPKQMITASEVVYSQILNAFPESKDELLTNYEKLFENLLDLDYQYKTVIGDATQNKFITYDNSFEHLQDYDFEYLSAEGNDTDVLKAYIEENNITKLICANNYSCNYYNVQLPDDMEIIEIDVIQSKPENGNYFSAQYKNILIFETNFN